MEDLVLRVASRFIEAKPVSRVHSKDPATEEAFQWLVTEREKIIAKYEKKIRDLKKQISGLEKQRFDDFTTVHDEVPKKFPDIDGLELEELLRRDHQLKGRLAEP